MRNFVTGVQLALGAAAVWLAIVYVRSAVRDIIAGWRKGGQAVQRLAHPEQPVCLARHDHKGRQLADHLRLRAPGLSDSELAAACGAFLSITLVASRRHGGHAADVLACDLDGAIRELTSSEAQFRPQRASAP